MQEEDEYILETNYRIGIYPKSIFCQVSLSQSLVLSDMQSCELEDKIQSTLENILEEYIAHSPVENDNDH